MLLAVPGSRGTDWLIGSGAAVPAEDAREVLQLLQGKAVAPRSIPEALRPIIDLLKQGADSPAGISQRTGQPLPAVLSALSEAELGGWIHRIAGGRYEVPRAE
jgi:predicted Rossmann fold nucleotide-binding protein DprA/Smf involved in DNA uptake